GGIWAPSDESGDACRFVQALAARAGGAGVSFRFNTSVKRLEAHSGRIGRVVIDDVLGIEESVRADGYVVALGSYSAQFLRPIGISLPIYPVKGYSITLPLADADPAPQISLTDHARKIVFSRLGSRLRVAGTAELNGFNTEIDAARCDALIERTRQLFPRIEGTGPPALWTGLRPATPSNQPLIGRTRYPNLFLNTGHGTLGWTLACGSGRAIADIIDGVRPAPDFLFL
ncbi:MAG: FAD-dependent oxidoreductase, partial [Betaproteobacteria bacterium]|nr:FAD-dependent oxidoreductase [Betaproteobacteria bacterium]